MQLITKAQPLERTTLKTMAEAMFGNLIKAVVDIKREVMIVDAQLHADEEQLLLEQGSAQKDLWGINLYPDNTNVDWIEFDSMINLRPAQGNRTRSVEDPTIQQKIRDIVGQLVHS